MAGAAAGLVLTGAACAAPAELADDSPEPHVMLVAPAATLTPKACSRDARQPFVPTRISITGVTAPVLALPRDEGNVPGVPGLSSADKQVFAWDAPGVKPGARRGNVLLNAHTWPDGTAMGNRLLAKLGEGERLVLAGSGSRLCYRVTDRIEVSVDNPPLDRVYDTAGPPQAVIVVCSGTRTGPGQWTHRTLWFASPIS